MSLPSKRLLATAPLLLQLILAGLYGVLLYAFARILPDIDPNLSVISLLSGKIPDEIILRRLFFWDVIIAFAAIVITCVSAYRYWRLLGSERKSPFGLIAALLAASIALWILADNRLFHAYCWLDSRSADMNLYEMIERSQ